MQTFIWSKGQLKPQPSGVADCIDWCPKEGVFSDGLLETLAVYEQGVFAVYRHWLRLQRSGLALGIKVPDLSIFRQAIDETIQLSRWPKSRLRVVILRNDLGFRLLLQLQEFPDYTAACGAVTSSLIRNESSPWTQHKTLNQIEHLEALQQAKAAGAGEALLWNRRGELVEGATSNLFLVDARDRLLTPNLASGCLPGVTRQLVLELAQKLQMEVIETQLTREILLQAKEAFLTSSLREIQALTYVDSHNFSSTSVSGSTTDMLQRSFQKLLQTHLDPLPITSL